MLTHKDILLSIPHKSLTNENCEFDSIDEVLQKNVNESRKTDQHIKKFSYLLQPLYNDLKSYWIQYGYFTKSSFTNFENMLKDKIRFIPKPNLYTLIELYETNESYDE